MSCKKYAELMQPPVCQYMVLDVLKNMTVLEKISVPNLATIHHIDAVAVRIGQFTHQYAREPYQQPE